MRGSMSFVFGAGRSFPDRRLEVRELVGRGELRMRFTRALRLVVSLQRLHFDRFSA